MFLSITVCWKLELLGSQEMTADVEVMFEAWNKEIEDENIYEIEATLTQDGPRGASFPMIMVQAASRDVRLFMVTDLTLIRWGWKKLGLIQFQGSWFMVGRKLIVIKHPNNDNKL